MTVFGQEVKPVVILAATKTGGIYITDIKIKGIVPAVLVFFLKGIEAKQGIDGPGKIITTCRPVAQRAL